MQTPTVHIPGDIIIYISILVGLVILAKIIDSLTSKKRKSTATSRRNSKQPLGRTNRRSSSVRQDEVILGTPIDQLSWAEFERLFALYFRSLGYEVKEPGVGGNDGGVDLVLIDKRTNERTAVQCKHWNDKKSVGPNIIRELYAARLNTKPTCHYGMLITSSDVSPQARKEAQARRIDYWHGGVLDMKLSQWSEWQGSSRRSRGKVRG